MPLNLNDPEDSSLPEKEKPEPRLYEPGEGGSKFPSKIVLIATLCVLVLAALYFAWKADLFGSRAKPEPESKIVSNQGQTAKAPEVTPVPPAAEPQHPINQQSIDEKHPNVFSAPPPSTAEPAKKHAGKYTIYISRQKRRELADEESGRWKTAGYESSVTEENGWYKVSIGRYASWEDAKAAAITLQDAFEAGYHIGTIEE